MDKSGRMEGDSFGTSRCRLGETYRAASDIRCRAMGKSFMVRGRFSTCFLYCEIGFCYGMGRE